jgi:hypothetical protein
MKEAVNQRVLGQNGRVWETLHPFHQKAASRAEYVDCESGDSFPGEVKNIEVVDQYDEPLRIPGQTTDTPSKAVTLRITYTVSGFDKPQVDTSTAHTVAVDGEWRWLLTPEDYRAYKANRCPPSD